MATQFFYFTSWHFDCAVLLLLRCTLHSHVVVRNGYTLQYLDFNMVQFVLFQHIFQTSSWSRNLWHKIVLQIKRRTNKKKNWKSFRFSFSKKKTLNEIYWLNVHMCTHSLVHIQYTYLLSHFHDFRVDSFWLAFLFSG